MQLPQETTRELIAIRHISKPPAGDGGGGAILNQCYWSEIIE